MAAPSSAKESAPKRERIAPTIQAAKTMETKRPSRAISAGFRKMPVPIMVPTTMAPEAQAPRPRISSRRFSVMISRLITQSNFGGRRGARRAVPLRVHPEAFAFAESAHHASQPEGHERPDQHVPCIRNAGESPNAKNSGEAGKHSDESAG